MSTKINPTLAALLIYDHLKSYPEKKFERNDFVCKKTEIEDFQRVDLTYRMVTRALEYILHTKKVTMNYETGNQNSKAFYQYTVADDSEKEKQEIRTAIIYAINRMQYNDLNFGASGDKENLHETITSTQSRWMGDATEVIEISEKQRIRLDLSMLDNLIELITHKNKRVWSLIYLIDENEEPLPNPVEMSLVKFIIQDRNLHCYGIKKTENSFTGEKIFLDQIHEISEGNTLRRSEKFIELESFLKDKINEVPDFFSR